MEKNNKDKPIRIAQIMGKWVGGGVEAVIAVKLLRGVYIWWKNQMLKGNYLL